MVTENFENYFKTFNQISEILKEKYEVDIDELIKILENQPTKDQIEKTVSELQIINDTLFEKYGANDTIIEFQICINKLRNYGDITDPKEIITHADDGDFVQ